MGSQGEFSQTFERLSGKLLQAADHHDRRGNVLAICHVALPLPDAPGLERGEQSFGQAIRVFPGSRRASSARGTRIECLSSELPFQDDAFQTVVLYHVLGNGIEPELHEASRVLSAGGQLLIVGVNRFGLNRNGWGGAFRRQSTPYPTIHLRLVCDQLMALDMTIDGYSGAGLLGRKRPFLAAPPDWLPVWLLMDVVLIRAGHAEPPLAASMRLKRNLGKAAVGIPSTSIAPTGMSPNTLI